MALAARDIGAAREPEVALVTLRETTASGFLSQTLFFGRESEFARKRGDQFPFDLWRLRLTADGRLRSRLTAHPPFTGSDISSPLR